MDKIKLTNHQLFSLTASGTMGGSVLIISSVLAGIAKQDAWIAVLFTIAFGMLTMWLYWYLGSQYPNMSLIGMIRKICGRWIGFIVAAFFVFSFLLESSYAVWYIGDYVTTQAMTETPANAINLLFVVAIVIAALYGIEVIARASELFIYAASILFLLTMFLVLPSVKIENLQPVFEKGIIPILKGSFFASTILTFPLITLMMIYPININNISKAKVALFKGYLWGCIVALITILMSILVLGSAITAKSRFPVYLLAKEITLTRFEFAITSGWIITQFIIATLFFYAGVIGLSEFLGLKDYRKIVVPLGLIAWIMTGVLYPDIIFQMNFVAIVHVPYITTFGLIMPALLLVVSQMKKWVSRGVCKG